MASVAAQQHALEAGGLVGPPALLAVPFSAIQPLDLLGSGEFCVVHCALLGGDYVALKRRTACVCLAPPPPLLPHVNTCPCSHRRLKASLSGSQCAEEDLRREIELLSHTSHPNIVRFLAHGLDDRGIPFCCLELFSRPDARQQQEVGRLHGASGSADDAAAPRRKVRDVFNDALSGEKVAPVPFQAPSKTSSYAEQIRDMAATMETSM